MGFKTPGQKTNTGLCFLHNNQSVSQTGASLEQSVFQAKNVSLKPFIPQYCYFQDKIVPPDPITAVEKTKTLQKLNQVIQHRLVTAKLPPEMGNMVIGKKNTFNRENCVSLFT